jgi:hypothetical protein
MAEPTLIRKGPTDFARPSSRMIAEAVPRIPLVQWECSLGLPSAASCPLTAQPGLTSRTVLLPRFPELTPARIRPEHECD